jgi:Protein of unknown function DUF262
MRIGKQQSTMRLLLPLKRDNMNNSEIIQVVDKTVNQVRTKSLDISFNELFDMYKSRELIISPDFQRLFRWSEDKQSQFIESLVLELPIPPVYVIETGDGVYELIDGLQRISSYIHFRAKELDLHDTRFDFEEPLVLSGCDVIKDINGKQFSDLPSTIQIKLKRSSIRLEILRKESDSRLKYHMFKRLNTGGEILSPQEVRNSTIRLLGSEFSEFLKDVAQNEDFRNCLEGLSDEKKKQMYFEEFALRFFATKNSLNTYVKEVGDFLTDYMERVSDKSIEDTVFDYKNEKIIFEQTFKILNSISGSSVFSGINKKGNPQGYFSALLFDAITVGIQDYIAHLIQIDPNELPNIHEKLNQMKRSDEFPDLFKGGGKNYAAALKKRIEFVKQQVQQWLN